MVGIDTVVLTLPIEKVAIMEPSRFTPNAIKVQNAEARDMGRNRYIDAFCNPSKADTAAYAGYLPYLTLYRALRSGGLVTELRVQFSAPKMIKGNNFDEIMAADFELLCGLILRGLAYYKIRVFGGLETIANSRIDAVHYSKNFVLKNFMSARQVTQELQRVDTNLWRDVSKSDYINNGHGIKVHSKHFELAIYDKIAEYNKGKRGQPTFDNDNQLRFELFQEKLTQPCEVVRMEVRLGNSKAIKRAFEQIGIESDSLSFRDIFKSEVSKSILQWHLADLYDHFPQITEAQAVGAIKLFSELYIQNPRRNMTTLLGAIGLYTLNKEVGLRAMKDIVGPKGSSALLRVARKANKELRYCRQKSEVFEVLDEQLDRFEPIQLSDFIK